jgi:hypothetical protein
MRSHAKKLKCHHVTKDTWTVWGGRDTHTIKDYGENYYECDCDSYKVNNVCSHIIRVKMELKEFPINDNPSSHYSF